MRSCGLRPMAKTFIALGGNTGDRLANLLAALERLEEIMTIERRSAVYETAPKYVTDQPPFFNMVVSGETDLAPEPLLDALKEIEQALGRVEGQRFGPRPIDLDILFYDDLQIDTPRLTIPHPRLYERRYVLAPLADIAPTFLHPASGQTIAEMLDALPPDDDVRRIDGEA